MALWFFQGSIFLKWKSTGSLLWIHGKFFKAGSGKSVICSLLPLAFAAAFSSASTLHTKTALINPSLSATPLRSPAEAVVDFRNYELLPKTRGFWGGGSAVILFVTVTVIVVGERAIRGGCNEVTVVVRGARSRTTRVRGAGAGAARVVAVVVRGAHGRKVGGPNTITAAGGGVLSVTAHVIIIVGVHAASYHCR
ncbi:hypothetical protein EDB83DRAFT_2318860 [Lactarius deliciosus]|nr:hypothetical protein EDB83DRAFT_2318860 [Lactarius deliciosus]